ncbi:uncharacterized protein EV422DRAFT_508947 [Fimicolochytrium jonesii]|uniref:uncharacterized protein n=1 Tax=Fimicolochytrium jonesii TaxID=1396493 RepID=UPI0022FED568|nr:uncharacterized protein EV422DRAFT_508947 [Fimicolochytrium jonesii]KAI8817347.1 hypothetical protein EV422DRAFT_508947 [Fimicolochytrium jonesii]
MSWKGFQKAVTRLPTKLAQATGYASETVDDEFVALNEQFKRVELLARKLTDDAKKFKDSLSAMLAHQARFAETLVEVYRPVQAVGAGGSPVAQGNPDLDDETQAASPGSNLKPNTQHPQSFAAAEAFVRSMRAAREELLPDLDVIERQVVAPALDYIALINNVKRILEKRSRKLVDYDRHKDSVKKLQAKPDRNLSDEKRLSSLEAQLDQATREFNNVDNIVRQELPIFLGLRTQFIDPCFQTLYWYELKVVEALNRHFSDLCHENGFDASQPPLVAFEAKFEGIMEALKELTLANRGALKRPAVNYQNPEEGYEEGGGEAPAEAFAPEDEHLPAYEEPNGAKGGYPSSPSKSNTTYKAYAGPSSSAASIAAAAMAARGQTPPAAASAGASSATRAAPPSTTPRTSFVIALYDFDGAEEGDLAFKKDDKIEVLERTPDTNDWWRGKCKGVTGQFPGNYVSDL